MKTVTIILLGCSLGFHAFATWDESLERDIKAWRKGERPPARLIKFPEGKLDSMPMCGLSTWGDKVDDYISRIENTDLLTAIIFDSQTEEDSFHAAARQLIRRKGVAHVTHLLAENRKTEPIVFARPGPAMLSQLLRSPYIAVQVARIAPEDMPPDKAQSVLQGMRADLQTGMSWADAYRKHADLHPDLQRRAKDPTSVGTLICYLFDSTVSPSGFDLLTYRMAEDLPVEHLRELFQAKRGTHVFRAAGGVYLYHIVSYYDASALPDH